MFRHALVLTTTWMLAALLVGCGEDYTKTDAEVRCRSLNSEGSPGYDEAFAQCVECFQECGDDCAVAESYPPQYNCQE